MRSLQNEQFFNKRTSETIRLILKKCLKPDDFIVDNNFPAWRYISVKIES